MVSFSAISKFTPPAPHIRTPPLCLHGVRVPVFPGWLHDYGVLGVEIRVRPERLGFKGCEAKVGDF